MNRNNFTYMHPKLPDDIKRECWSSQMSILKYELKNTNRYTDPKRHASLVCQLSHVCKRMSKFFGNKTVIYFSAVTKPP
jgi:hypothetical protein